MAAKALEVLKSLPSFGDTQAQVQEALCLSSERARSDIDVSEQNWARIRQDAKGAAAKLDVTEVQMMKDQPRNHDVGSYGPTGSFIKVSYRGNLVISGYTGCRLPRGNK